MASANSFFLVEGQAAELLLFLFSLRVATVTLLRLFALRRRRLKRKLSFL